MKPTRAILAALALCASPLLASAVEPASKIVAFNASVRVDVDASGKPVKVEAPADLPDTIRDYIEKRVASWQYEPAKQGGVAVSAVTYVQVAACAVPMPTGTGYHLAADFDGNGLRNAGDQRTPPPMYPANAQRHGIEADFVVIVDVDAGGKARLGSIEKATISRAGRPVEFEQELRRWAKTLRFDPEQVAGRAVAGQVRIPVNFEFQTQSEWRSMRDDILAKINASRECQMAQGDDAMRPVAIDSVVKVTPVPAS